jgi:hypothetical protein
MEEMGKGYVKEKGGLDMVKKKIKLTEPELTGIITLALASIMAPMVREAFNRKPENACKHIWEYPDDNKADVAFCVRCKINKPAKLRGRK